MDNPIVNLEKLSEPITRLIEVISKGVGTLYAPFGIIRQAKAEAEAKIIHANAEIKIAGLKERANSRQEYREALRQENIEAISVIAARELPEKVSSSKPSQDWILQFFDCAQDVCDEDIQILWGRILAGEVVSPGSYSKRTLQFLRTLEKYEAEKFTQLCSFAFTDEQGKYYLVEEQTLKEMSEEHGVDLNIDHFVSIGLLSTEISSLPVSSVTGLELNYFGKKYELCGPSPQMIPALEPMCLFRYFSSMGQELARIAGSTPIEGGVERLSNSLSAQLQVSLHKRTQS